MLENLLQRCGIAHSEQAVLIFLLERGSASASQIARTTALKRPTVYAGLENLVSAGLVYKEKHRAGTIFRALSRQSIPKVLERNAKAEYDSLREAATRLGEQLNELPTRDRVQLGGFELSSIESSKAVYYHLEEVLHRGDFSAIFNPQLIPTEQLKGPVTRFLKNTSVSQPRIREIAVSGTATNWYRRQIRNKNHQVKEISPKRKILSDIILVSGEVVVSNYEVNSELAVRIREENLYTTLMSTFNMLWESLS